MSATSPQHLPTIPLSTANQQARHSISFHQNRSIPKPHRTSIAFNKIPDPKAIDNLPQHHRLIISSKSYRWLTTNSLNSLQHSGIRWKARILGVLVIGLWCQENIDRLGCHHRSPDPLKPASHRSLSENAAPLTAIECQGSTMSGIRW
jgi:hypothetical protein